MLSFDQLNIFRAIVRARSFTRAAEECYLTQSALSQRIKHLEQSLGVELFDRSKKGKPLTLTDAGEIVLRFAEESVCFQERLHEEIRLAKHGRPRETVSIACGPSISRYIFPTILASFAKRRPHALVQVLTGVGQELSAMVRAGTVELALTSEQVPAGRLDVRPLFEYGFMLVRSADYPWPLEHDIVRDGWPTDRRFAVGQLGSALREAAERIAAALNTTMDVAIECSSTDALKNFAACGLGVGVVPEYTVATELEAGSMVEIPCSIELPKAQLSLVNDSKLELSAPASSLVEVLEELNWESMLTLQGQLDQRHAGGTRRLEVGSS